MPKLMPAITAHELATHPEFRRRVKILLLRTAAFVLSEDPNTPGHETRARYAVSAIADPESATRRASFLGLAVTPVPNAIANSAVDEIVVNHVFLAQADDLILQALGAGWNALSGVYQRAETPQSTSTATSTR